MEVRDLDMQGRVITEPMHTFTLKENERRAGSDEQNTSLSVIFTVVDMERDHQFLVRLGAPQEVTTRINGWTAAYMPISTTFVA